MRKYFSINESAARVANDINSFREYTENSATNGYIAACDEVYQIAEEVAEKKPAYAEKAAYMAERYAKKYADYLNAYYRNEASCPSILICGGGNFPVKKKNRQNSRRETLHDEYNRLESYKDKIRNLLTCNQPILSNEADAIERIQDKINDLEADKALMIAINKYYRKNKTLEGFEDDIPDELQRRIKFAFGFLKDLTESTGHIFDTTNTNAEINRLKDRLKSLTAIKEKGTTEKEYEGFQVVENAELMRLQIIFEYKPDEETRNVLKSNGFKWAPSQGAWQRQLTPNAKYSLKRVLEVIA